MDERHDRATAPLAASLGLVAAGSAVSLATYFVAGGPFGTINDIGNGATGVLAAALAWRLRSEVPGRAGDLTAGLAAAGAALTVVGSTLVVSGTTGFFLAGLVSSVGFAGVGAWLVAVNARGNGPRTAAWPRRLRSTGMAAGALMAAGIAAAPGIALRLDDMATAPGWIWVGQLGWLGTFVVLPVWALWLARAARRDSGHRLAAGELVPEAATRG